MEAHAEMDAIVAGFDLTRLGRAPARFDPAELQRLNVKLLQSLSYEKVAYRLLSLGIQCDDTQTGTLFWETVRGNIDKLEDALALWKIIQGPRRKFDRRWRQCLSQNGFGLFTQ